MKYSLERVRLRKAGCRRNVRDRDDCVWDGQVPEFDVKKALTIAIAMRAPGNKNDDTLKVILHREQMEKKTGEAWLALSTRAVESWAPN